MPPTHRFAALVGATALGAALAPAAPAGAETLRFFQSPSRNIGCLIGSSHGARCDIKQREWSPGKRPAGCPSFTDYGQGLIVGARGRGHVVCAGDTTLNAGPVLGYGKSRRVGRYTCTSRTSGITCRNRRTGHGFRISRQSYRLF